MPPPPQKKINKTKIKKGQKQNKQKSKKKQKPNKYHSVRTVPKSNRNITKEAL